MGYRLRKVPANWEHPKDISGNYMPMFDGSYKSYVKEYREEEQMWNKGFELDYSAMNPDGSRKFKPKNNFIPPATTFRQWAGGMVKPKFYRPEWTDSEMTHFQLYENVTEGTPVSPVFETKEAAAEWASNNIGNCSYEEYLDVFTKDDPTIGVLYVLL